jgi:hypothetical protein
MGMESENILKKQFAQWQDINVDLLKKILPDIQNEYQ